MRHSIRDSLVAEATKPKGTSKKSTQKGAQKFDENGPVKVWEYAVLVTNSRYLIERMEQLYRGRADRENGFDELRISGDGVATAPRTLRCNLSARAVALVYNWWSGYATSASESQIRGNHE